jgi:hypothetical protein
VFVSWQKFSKWQRRLALVLNSKVHKTSQSMKDFVSSSVRWLWLQLGVFRPVAHLFFVAAPRGMLRTSEAVPTGAVHLYYEKHGMLSPVSGS